MNLNELKAELVRHNLSIPAASKLIEIGKKAFYCKIKGESQFNTNSCLNIDKVYLLNVNSISSRKYES